ncbi:hypothetical protein [Kordia sp.]|uniref:hypothetical protein n=1 Tax=Kordia sp. TaxID=1965332 RepID=UPI003B59B2F7
MSKKIGFNEIKIWFDKRFISITLNEHFRIHDKEIQVLFAEFKEIDISQLTEQNYVDILNFIKLGVEQSEQIVTQFFQKRKEQIEPLYSSELNHYYLEIDICSLNISEKHSPIIEFDIRFDCMDKKNHPIFMYDSRGLCHIEFEVNKNKELIVKEVS